MIFDVLVELWAKMLCFEKSCYSVQKVFYITYWKHRSEVYISNLQTPIFPSQLSVHTERQVRGPQLIKGFEAKKRRDACQGKTGARRNSVGGSKSPYGKNGGLEAGGICSGGPSAMETVPDGFSRFTRTRSVGFGCLLKRFKGRIYTLPSVHMYMI